MELLALGLGLLVGGIVGFNFGVRKTADACHEVAHKFVDALRERFGSTRVVHLAPDVQTEIELLDPELEELAKPLFHLE